MKYTLILFCAFLLLFSCTKDSDDSEGTDYAYHAHIKSPDTEAKHLDDQIHINVLFESHSGQIVHNISVRIWKKGDESNLVYDHTEHAHQIDGYLDFNDDFVLSEANGFEEHSDWIMEAAVWGHEGEDDGYESERIEFHVHPK